MTVLHVERITKMSEWTTHIYRPMYGIPQPRVSLLQMSIYNFKRQSLERFVCTVNCLVAVDTGLWVQVTWTERRRRVGQGQVRHGGNELVDGSGGG